jgi:pantothenate kinase
VTPSVAELAQRVRGIASRSGGERVLIGIAGAPGAGKTTLAQALTLELGPEAAHVPMDGFHLSDAELSRLGRADRKGAPDTFDVDGYVALLDRLGSGRRPPDSVRTVWAPAFDRALDQPIAGGIAIEPAQSIVVSEGNYLLLDQPGWDAVAERFDEVWFCALDSQTRLGRLVARHERFGKASAEAVAWATGPDQRNAELVEASRGRATLEVRPG